MVLFWVFKGFFGKMMSFGLTYFEHINFGLVFYIIHTINAYLIYGIDKCFNISLNVKSFQLICLRFNTADIDVNLNALDLLQELDGCHVVVQSNLSVKIVNV